MQDARGTASGSRQRATLVDWLSLAGGVLMLVLAGGLVQVLPDQEATMPQYRLAVREQTVQFPSQSLDVADGARHDFPYRVEHDNAFRFTIGFRVQDQEASSLPDRFVLQLLDPEGRPSAHHTT